MRRETTTKRRLELCVCAWLHIYVLAHSNALVLLPFSTAPALRAYALHARHQRRPRLRLAEVLMRTTHDTRAGCGWNVLTAAAVCSILLLVRMHGLRTHLCSC